MERQDYDAFIAEMIGSLQSQVDYHIEAGDSELAARRATRLAVLKGHQSRRQRLMETWPTQKTVAQILELDPRDRWRVSRLVKDGKLKTNGRKGKACRINPQSVLEYLKDGCCTVDPY